MELQYEDDIEIDESALDIEWLNQAPLALKYAKNWAQCSRDLRIAQEEIKIIRSELIKEANEQPEKCIGKGKPNAADIEAYYRNHLRHKDVKQKIIDFQYAVDVAEIAKNEISFTRKAALENMVVLHGQQYFAGPKVPRNLGEEKERWKSINQKVKMKKRVKGE